MQESIDRNSSKYRVNSSVEIAREFVRVEVYWEVAVAIGTSGVAVPLCNDFDLVLLEAEQLAENSYLFVAFASLAQEGTLENAHFVHLDTIVLLYYFCTKFRASILLVRKVLLLLSISGALFGSLLGLAPLGASP